MRKLVYTLIAVIGFTAMSFGQEAINTANSADKSELAISKKSGEYAFTFPATVTEEQMKKNASYYTKMFTVTFDANTHIAKVKMVENTSANRTIITRLMISCGVRYVEVEGDTIKVYDFVAEYLK